MAYEIPDYYEFIEFSVCGCVAAGYSDTEKKIIVVESESGRQREVDVSDQLDMKKKYQSVFRIEKRLVYVCVFLRTDFELHVEVDMRSKKWKVHTQFTDQYTDKTISEDGCVIVEQWDNSENGLDYMFEINKTTIVSITAPHPRRYSEEAMLMLSYPAGKYCYIKSWGMLFVPETQKKITMPFKTPFAHMEWIDDTCNVVSIDTGTHRELWRLKGKEWNMLKRMEQTQFPGQFPFKNTYSMLGQTVMLNGFYFSMVPQVSNIYFGRESWNVFANGLLRFNVLK